MPPTCLRPGEKGARGWRTPNTSSLGSSFPLTALALTYQPLHFRVNCSLRCTLQCVSISRVNRLMQVSDTVPCLQCGLRKASFRSVWSHSGVQRPAVSRYRRGRKQHLSVSSERRTPPTLHGTHDRQCYPSAITQKRQSCSP